MLTKWTFCKKSILKRKKHLFLLSLGLMANAIAHGALMLLLGPFMKALLSAGQTSHILLSELFPFKILSYAPWLKNKMVSFQALQLYIPLILVFAGFFRVFSVFLYEQNSAILALGVANDYRVFFFSRLLAQPYELISSKSPGVWMSHVVNDVLYLQMRLGDILKSLLYDSVMMGASFFGLFLIHPPTALVFLCLGPLLAKFAGSIGKKLSLYAKSYQTSLAFLASHILDLRKRFFFVKAQNGFLFEQTRFAYMNRQYRKALERAILIKASFAPCVEFLGFFCFSLLLFFLPFLRSFESFSSLNLLVFFGAVGLLFKPLKNMGEQFSRFQETFGSLLGPWDPFHTENSKPSPSPVNDRSDSDHALTFTGFTIKEFYIRQKNGFECKIAHWKIPPNKIIAITGVSGSGKSTFLKVLAGLIEPETWEASLSLKDLSNISNFVGQSPFLFQGSLKENLYYGNTPQKCSDTEEKKNIRLLFKDAEWNNLATLFNPLNTTMSGGQIQRMVLLRAFLRKNKPLWLFDEVSSALSLDAEASLLTVLKDFVTKEEGKTILYVTHRTENLEHFDEVWTFPMYNKRET